MPKKQKSQPITGDIEKKFYSRLLLVLIIIAAAPSICCGRGPGTAKLRRRLPMKWF